jgi:hypothetical protein
MLQISAIVCYGKQYLYATDTDQTIGVCWCIIIKHRRQTDMAIPLSNGFQESYIAKISI